MMFATAKKLENIPLLKDILIMSLNGSESGVSKSSDIFLGILLEPIILFGLMRLIRDYMSAGAIEHRKIVSLVVCLRSCENRFLARDSRAIYQ